MQRPLYAVCPRCGSRAEITRFIRDMEEDESFAMIKCACGRYRIPYVEGRVVSVDLNNPYMKEDHYDLLLPAALTEDMWNRVSKCLTNW